ncbi:caspase family protein [uncultured Paludibaculum sp.]|uniref:caspase family protein n=1 Tax=uncultured Paludibaculum sp. TaxID=1765020 RepID=UPI002AAB3CEB|nr:caspase family protein [uncultured Paludibaculum sp.]
MLSVTAWGQEQRDLTFRKQSKAPTSRRLQAPRGFALVVGISRYEQEGITTLKFPESDADAVYRVLISKEGGGIPAENVHKLIGRDANLANIRREVEQWLPSVAAEQDRVVVYFAGHGFVQRGKGYLAPWDIDPEHLDATGYPMQALGNTLAMKVKARWKTLFTDACHSGKINSETTNEAVWSELNSSMDAAQFLSLVASIGAEKSYEDPLLSTGFGIFSYFLVQGLKGQADNDPCDGWVDASELVEYVRSNVRKYARDHGYQQTPNAGSDYDPSMILAKAKGCGLGGVDTTLTGVLVVDANQPDVEVWIDGEFAGKIGVASPLRVPGLSDGPHSVCGRKDGYEPDCKDVLIAPGQELGVPVRMRYPRLIKPKARALNEKGERLLYTRRSGLGTVNPANMLPWDRTQSANDIREARKYFAQALAEDPHYSRAAYQLGVANQLMSDEAASISSFRRAIEIDADYIEARLHLSGVLTERGDPDEAIRQLTEVLRLDSRSDQAFQMMARAYLDKGVWNRCVDAADHAIALNRGNAEALLWRADCLRRLAVDDKSVQTFAAARDSYREFLDVFNYSTPVHEWLLYHFVGFGIGGRAHADRKVSYEYLRKAGFLGLCICERRLGHSVRAREYCRRAIQYDDQDATAYFLLGLAHLGVFAKTESCEDVYAARASFAEMLRINSALAESRRAREYIEEIDGRRSELKQKGCAVTANPNRGSGGDRDKF